MAEGIGEKTGKAVDSSIAATKEAKDKVQNEIEADLHATQVKISDLKQKTLTASQSVKKDLESQINNLEKDQKSLQVKIAKMKKSSGKAWDQMKNGAEAALKSLKESYEKAKNEFSERTDSKN